MHALSRWWMRRRHGEGEWGGLFAPSSAGEWVSLDLETTGIDPARDHILSLAAVPVRDGTAWLSERFERRVHTARAFGIESIRHHRITPDEASAGEPVVEVVREFLHWLGGRRLLGYNLGFDLDMLAPHVRALAGFDLPNPTVDLADAVAAAQRRQRPDAPVNLDLVHIANRLGVPMIAATITFTTAATAIIRKIGVRPSPARALV